ncbi:cytochrome c biogenesis protein CcdA, partial [Bosea sp. (in: a-proteobacteria)]|uniref:cytochrome c biogenesis protein CcdA n=1 Tax=Bosea sp. (in: a-proteobacteria) TaxID=1871050 RepID=UPI0012239D7F
MEIANISILAALAAGAVSFLSPCVLPLVPGYLSYVAGSLSADSDSPIARIRALAM